jgi:glycosyltransferase involved in cell wall biosynthesis
MVVNNDIAHDARVLKSATTLARAGADVFVLGAAADGRLWRASDGSVTYLRTPVLPPRAVSGGYAVWAARRRAGRLSAADQWRRSLPATRYFRRAWVPALASVAPDVVHVHDVHPLAVAVEYAASRPVRVVYDAHEYVPGLAVGGARTQRAVDGWAALEREYIGRVERVITVAPGIAEVLRETYRLRETPHVVYNAPVAGDFAAPRSLRQEAGVGADVPLAVYSGALSAARGVETAVAALAHLPQLHLAVVTVPFPHPFAAQLRAAADRAAAADRLHLVAPVPSATVPSYLSEADVAVSPILPVSASYDMALPNKLFEFLHAGLPIAVSDCKAMAAFVAEHGLGRSFRAGDAADLAASVRAILADPPRPDTSALRREFSWQAQETRLVAAYADLVDGLSAPVEPFPFDEVGLNWQPG